MPANAVKKVAPSLLITKGPVSVFVQLNKQAAADAFDANAGRGRAAAKKAAKAAAQASDAAAASVVQAAKGKDAQAKELYKTHNAVAGVALTTNASTIKALAARTDVLSIRALTPKKLANAHAEQLTQVLNAWQTTGMTGAGVTVGIIDSGIDYTHADFGGAGTSAAYDAIDPTAPTPAFPSAKVVGGTDLAGENYDASSDNPVEFIPNPDGNPLDCDGHGSHVAGTAAGFGVNSDGSTFTGNYQTLTGALLDAMRIGPGMAPNASLYAIKVFGCPGGEAASTNLVAPAIDWALDPNQDGDLSDHLNIVNLSLGADYGAPDDPEADFVRNAVKHNLLVVISAGNAGDIYDVGGSPGNTPEALTVASSRDDYELLDAAEETAPGSGMFAGQYSVALDYDGVDVTQQVVKLTEVGNEDGCAAFNVADAAAVSGKIAWLWWDDNDATRQCGSAGRSANAVAAGAVGVILTSTLSHFNGGITGSAVIPVFQATGPSTTALQPLVDAGTLWMRLAGDLRQTVNVVDPAIADTPSGFTSRSTRTPGVKPDVSAPGDTIVSAGKGSGNKAAVLSGTSMASPHVTGIAALVRQAHPTWNAAEVKAAIMDTATHDIYSGDGQVLPIEAPNRSGTGRVDALGATTSNVLAFVKDSPTTVSVGFGVVEVEKATMKLEKHIHLVNKGNTAVTYNVSYQVITTIPGVSYSLDKATVTIKANSAADVKVTLNITRDLMTKTIDPTTTRIDPLIGLPRDYVADASGRVTFTPTAGTTVPLRVAVYSAPKPTSALTVPAKLKAGGTGFLQLGGRGLDQGIDEENYLALYSALELGDTSTRLKLCTKNQVSGCAVNGTAKGGDIHYVGAASTAPQENMGGDPLNSMLGFGIATWENWYNIGANTIPFVDIDVDGDDVPDFETYAIRLADSDLLLVFTDKLSSGDTVDVELVDGAPPGYDTNIFDTNVIMLPVWLPALGIDPTDASHRITYQVGVVGYYTAPADALIDFSKPVSYDPLSPGLWAEGGGASLTYIGDPGTGLLIHRNPASLALDKSDSLLVLMYQNPTASRAKAVKIQP